MSIPVYIEIFSGSGRLAAAFGRVNELCIVWDITLGPQYDLTKPYALSLICGWLRAGQLRGVHLGTPCTSFSRIRGVGHGPGRLRSSAAPRGIESLANEADLEIVRKGNIILDASCSIFSLCQRHEVPVSLENPSTSILWCTPQINYLRRSSTVRRVVTDFCMWGMPWRKSTAFLTCRLVTSELEQHRCRGAAPGLCARSGCRHIQLVGRSPNGVFWTKIAEPYPPKMCDSLVSSFVNSDLARKASRFSALLA